MVRAVKTGSVISKAVTSSFCAVLSNLYWQHDQASIAGQKALSVREEGFQHLVHYNLENKRKMHLPRSKTVFSIGFITITN